MNLFNAGEKKIVFPDLGTPSTLLHRPVEQKPHPVVKVMKIANGDAEAVEFSAVINSIPHEVALPGQTYKDWTGETKEVPEGSVAITMHPKDDTQKRQYLETLQIVK